MRVEPGVCGPADAPDLARIARDAFDRPWSEAAFRDALSRDTTRAFVARGAARAAVPAGGLCPPIPGNEAARSAAVPAGGLCPPIPGKTPLDDLPIVGYVLAAVVIDEVQILTLAVDREWRRRGIAARLLAEVLERARDEGLRSVTLEVRESNAAALGLYRGLGLVEQGRRSGYYAGRETALLYGAAL